MSKRNLPTRIATLAIVALGAWSCKARTYNADVRSERAQPPFASTIPEKDFDMVSYWRKCAEHLGEPPTFNYAESVPVPLFQKSAPVDITQDPHVTDIEVAWSDLIPPGSPRRMICNDPTGVGRDDKENMACVPASRALRVQTKNQKGEAIEWQVLFRRLSADHEAPPGSGKPIDVNTQYDVQNLIAKNMVTGATCFADALPNNAFYRAPDGKVTPVYEQAEIEKKMREVAEDLKRNPKSTAKVFFSVTGSDWPNLLTGNPRIINERYKPMFADCTRCHNHDAWTRNPWIGAVRFPAGSDRPIVPPQRKLAMAKEMKVPPAKALNMAFEPYFIVEQENVRKLLARTTTKPDVDAQPYSLDVKILNVADNKCRTCHEIGQRHVCGETVPMAFGLNTSSTGGNGFGIDYNPPKIFARRLGQYFQSKIEKTWPANGWHNEIIGVTAFPKTAEKVNGEDRAVTQSRTAIANYRSSLEQVISCCQTFQPGEKLAPECKWVRAPYVPGREVVTLDSTVDGATAAGRPAAQSPKQEPSSSDSLRAVSYGSAPFNMDVGPFFFKDFGKGGAESSPVQTLDLKCFKNPRSSTARARFVIRVVKSINDEIRIDLKSYSRDDDGFGLDVAIQSARRTMTNSINFITDSGVLGLIRDPSGYDSFNFSHLAINRELQTYFESEGICSSPK